MGILLAALVVGILSYVGFALLFPKALPEEGTDHMRDALDRIYEENRAGQTDNSAFLKDQLSEESAIVQMLFNSALMRPIYEAALQAGYQHNMRPLILLMLGGFFGSLLLFSSMKLGLLSILLAAVIGYYLPYRHCKKRVRKRNNKFIDQFPDALDMIVRSVRSGFPLAVALQMLAENAENPVKEEFRTVVNDIALGRTLQEALRRLSGRINEPDIRFFVVVLTVQQETGGNLAEIIGNLSNIIRKRKQLRHKIHAMTSEGRATGWVLGLLPIFVFIVLYLMQPDYLEPLWTEQLGIMLLGIAGGLLATCYIVVKQMINIDI